MGIPPEDLELVRRRTEALGICIFGLLTIIPGAPLVVLVVSNIGTYQERGLFGPYTVYPNAQAGLIMGVVTGILGAGILLYGNYLWGKYTHIMWTKQALREFDEEKMRLTGELRDYEKKGGEYGVFGVLRKEGIGIVPTGIRALMKNVGLMSEKEKPVSEASTEVESMEREPKKDDIISQKEKIQDLLEKLNERFVTGGISEPTYKELKSYYEERLKKIEAVIAQRITEHKCPRCGASLKQDANFCSQCGFKVFR